VTETRIRNESGGTNGIGLLLDVAREGTSGRLIWRKTTWGVTQEEMADLFHEGCPQSSRTLGVVEKNEDRALIGETQRGPRPQLWVTKRLTKISRQLIQFRKAQNLKLEELSQMKWIEGLIRPE